VTDVSGVADDDQPLTIAAPTSQLVPEGVDGFLRANGVLRFNETIDM
jgi:CDK inhibitor PHO81